MTIQGLTWGDSMELNRWHFAAILSNSITWGIWVVAGGSTFCPVYVPALFGFAFCQAIFWRDLVVLDSFLLLRECAEMEHETWLTFSRNYFQRPYLEWQTPFVPYLIARCSGSQMMIWLCSACCGALNVMLICAHFQSDAGFLLACPLTMLTLCQPSTDLPMLTGVLLTFVCLDHDLIMAAAVMFALSAMIKPLALCLYPFLIFMSPVFIVSALIWCLAWSELRDQPWVRHQIDFLLHQCCLVPLPSLRRISAEARRKTGKPRIGWIRWVRQTIIWRLKTITLPALMWLPVYVLPICFGWASFRLPGAVLAGVLAILYGNLKYYMLALVILF